MAAVQDNPQSSFGRKSRVGLFLNFRKSNETVLSSESLVIKWRLREAFGLGLLLLLITMVVVFIMIDVGPSLFPGKTDFQRTQVLEVLWSAAVLVIFMPLLRVVKKIRNFGEFWRSIDWNPNQYVVPSALVGFVFAVPIILVTGDKLRLVAPRPFTLVILVAVLSQALLEECYFRGILFLALAGKVGQYGAAVAAALIFAYFHPLHRIDVLPASLLISLARVRTKSVAACFALHASYNIGLFFMIGLLA